MYNDQVKITSKNFKRYHKIMEDNMISEVEKKLTKLAFILVNKRIEKNLTQNEVVERSRLSKSVVSKMESFISIPTSITLVKYADAVDMELTFVEKSPFEKDAKFKTKP